MIYPPDFEVVTGFRFVRELLISLCRYESSSAAATRMTVLKTAGDVVKRFDETDEWSWLIARQPSVQQLVAPADISKWLLHLGVENFFLDEEELSAIAAALQCSEKFIHTIQKNAAEIPNLVNLLQESEDASMALTLIQRVISEDGKLLPYASALYGKLNAEYSRVEKDARQVTYSIFKSWKSLGYTAETEITVREERLVIPLLAEYKRKVQGLVKDISATGKVLYTEPIESLELNNRLTEIHAEIRRERERILRETASKLAVHKPGIAASMKMLSDLDLVRARFELARKLHAQRPQVTDQPQIHLKQAVNPQLWLHNRDLKRETVPMEIKLNDTDRILIISGPNAGGKSISLKTGILLQYMAQCGLFITALPESCVGIFESYSIDCGDGQSISDGLSTFSAHLQHLKNMLASAGNASLVAIDELGDGTDPRFGGPIAQAVLEAFLTSGTKAIVTTHFSRLKEWANEAEGVVNASMAYDLKELRPLYKLVTGKPGNSFAPELMRKTGFGDEMIERVNELSGEHSGRTEDLLMDLSAKHLEMEERLKEIESREKQLQELQQGYQEIKDKLIAKKSEILENARKEAARLLRDTNREIELTIRAIKENRAEPAKTKKTREKLEQFEKKRVQSKEKKASFEISPKEIPALNLLPGMKVKSALNDAVGEVLEVKDNKVLASFGLVKIWVEKSELRPVEGKSSGPVRKKSQPGFDWVAKQASFQPVRDIRGFRAEEALKSLQPWMDEAYALGQKQLKLIHGRGDGILRKTVHTWLKTLTYVKNWKAEREEQGGDGCTLIELF